MRNRILNIVVAAGLVVLNGFVYYQASTVFPRQGGAGAGGPAADAAFFPQVLAVAMMLLGLLIIGTNLIPMLRQGWETLAATGSVPESAPLPPVAEAVQDRPSLGRLLTIAGILLLYTVFLPYAGYLIATPLLMIGLFRLLGIKRPLTILLLAVISTLMMYVFFSELLNVVLPWGRWLP